MGGLRLWCVPNYNHILNETRTHFDDLEFQTFKNYSFLMFFRKILIKVRYAASWEIWMGSGRLARYIYIQKLIKTIQNMIHSSKTTQVVSMISFYYKKKNSDATMLLICFKNCWYILVLFFYFLFCKGFRNTSAWYLWQPFVMFALDAWLQGFIFYIIRISRHLKIQKRFKER